MPVPSAAHASLAGDGAGLPRVPAAFTPTPRVQELLGGLPSVVVLRAPRGFGKSSTVAHWLRRTDLPDHDVVWVTVPPRPISRAELWAAVHLAMVRAGFDDPGAEGWDRVVRGARAGRRRLVLVIDGLDQVGDREVDEELVTLGQTHQELHLALLMRARRPVETLARVALDTVVLRREDLVLESGQVADLARAIGRPVSAAEARRLTDGLGGWAGLVRAALLTSEPGPDGVLALEMASLADYLRLVLQDGAMTAAAPAVTALAVPDHVTPELAGRLAGAGALAGAVSRAREAGLLPEHGGDGPDAVAYPAIVRELLLRILREDEPDRYRMLNRVTMEHCLRAGEPLAALTHAVRTQDPRAVVAVLESAWPQLLAHPEPVREALTLVPAELLAASARGRVARDHILPAEVPRSFRLALVSGLRHGDYVPGADAAPAPGPGPVRAPGPGPGAHAGPDDDHVHQHLLLLGATRLLEADVVRAAHAFTDAGLCAQASGDRSATAQAHGGLALSLAFLGHPDAARRYLGELPGPDAPGLAQVAARVVPALLALDGLDPHTADLELDLPADLAGLEATSLYVRAGRALHAGGSEEMLGRLERFHRGPAGGSALAENLVVAALVDLYLATDQADRARSLLGSVPAAVADRSVWLRAARARVALYAGDHELALELGGRSAEMAALRPRAALGLSLVRAVAAHRAGHQLVAMEALELATSLALSSGNVRAFVLVPRDDLEAVAAAVPAARALLVRPELAASPPLPAPHRAVRLSRSELRVLGELASGRPVTHVARRLYVSESTIKTQVRSIYRKLGVHSRADALSRARSLGILAPDAPE
ncbi:LuxR C-terminal-related transcriptional regulator [Georgenia sp. SYP-B2076]|uniref:LuxR C-terminal-related transcriptional regulator n=1 Tax=Georgenia sp. SYP-B2076 TaxID=2495881 RepID=UPI000F8EC1C2|nr:LuxR C-terminal-related transcriptional regulator [Georgenia sp. SYP-B2076]